MLIPQKAAGVGEGDGRGQCSGSQTLLEVVNAEMFDAEDEEGKWSG